MLEGKIGVLGAGERIHIRPQGDSGPALGGMKVRYDTRALTSIRIRKAHRLQFRNDGRCRLLFLEGKLRMPM